MTGFIENELVASGLLYRPYRIDLSLVSNNVFYKLLIPEPQIMSLQLNLEVFLYTKNKTQLFLLLCWFLFSFFLPSVAVICPRMFADTLQIFLHMHCILSLWEQVIVE